MAGQKNHKTIQKILDLDVRATKSFVAHVLQYPSFKSLQIYSKFLEISCNGIVWLSTWIAFIYLINKKSFYEVQFNILLGLIVDILIIALAKSFFRRRRPVPCDDMLTIGPDKFSFPSGHASRAGFLFMFFVYLYPLATPFWLPIMFWAICVSLSRIIILRHYILDVVCGIVIGFAEAFLLSIIWIGPDTAVDIYNFVSNDYASEETD